MLEKLIISENSFRMSALCSPHHKVTVAASCDINLQLTLIEIGMCLL